MEVQGGESVWMGRNGFTEEDFLSDCRNWKQICLLARIGRRITFERMIEL